MIPDYDDFLGGRYPFYHISNGCIRNNDPKPSKHRNKYTKKYADNRQKSKRNRRRKKR